MPDNNAVPSSQGSEDLPARLDEVRRLTKEFAEELEKTRSLAQQLRDGTIALAKAAEALDLVGTTLVGLSERWQALIDKFTESVDQFSKDRQQILDAINGHSRTLGELQQLTSGIDGRLAPVLANVKSAVLAATIAAVMVGLLLGMGLLQFEG